MQYQCTKHKNSNYLFRYFNNICFINVVHLNPDVLSPRHLDPWVGGYPRVDPLALAGHHPLAAAGEHLDLGPAHQPHPLQLVLDTVGTVAGVSDQGLQGEHS